MRARGPVSPSWRTHMPDIDWMIRGPEIATCNCAWGCPCQFNALPTNGNCRAAIGARIDEGYFGDVRLDGPKFAGTAAFPGAIHEGHGILQPIIDERADKRQRAALLDLMAGKHTDPGATFFSVLATVLETVHPPMFKPIVFEADLDNATGHFSVEGIVEGRAEPIRNPVTGEPHFAKLSLRSGFEFIDAEFASSTVKAAKPIELDWQGRHAHLAMLHWTGR